MRKQSACWVVIGFALVLSNAAPTFAQELAAMDAETSREYGQALSDKFKKLEDQQVKVEPSASDASGLSVSGEGIILVPTKRLEGSEVDPAVQSETGAPLAYLFTTPRFNPLNSGKPFESKQLRTIRYGGDNGQEREATCFILAVRHVEGDEWRLYVYGSEKKPLIEAKFFEADDVKEKPLSIHVNDVKDGKATLVVNVMKKYEASFEIGH